MIYERAANYLSSTFNIVCVSLCLVLNPVGCVFHLRRCCQVYLNCFLKENQNIYSQNMVVVFLDLLHTVSVSSFFLHNRAVDLNVLTLLFKHHSTPCINSVGDMFMHLLEIL